MMIRSLPYYITFIATLLLLAGCSAEKPKTTVWLSSFEDQQASEEQIARYLDVLHKWTAERGHRLLTSPEEIAESTKWSGGSSKFSEVYLKSIGAPPSESLFTVTVLKIEGPEPSFHISLLSRVIGDKAAHVQQEPLVRAEEKSFQDALQAAKPAKSP